MSLLNGGSGGYFAPRVIQFVGLVSFIGFGIFWAVSGRESVLFMTMSGSMIMIGGYEGAKRKLEDINKNFDRRNGQAQ